MWEHQSLYDFTVAFAQYLNYNSSLEESYVDGVSLTHGAAGERQHIWTFAAGLSEGMIYSDEFKCPHDFDSESPPYVNGDYFCESGNNNDSSVDYVFFGSDPLWDGEGCGFNTTSCQFNNPPYFSKILPAPTTDDIELRLCHYTYLYTICRCPYRTSGVVHQVIKLYTSIAVDISYQYSVTMSDYILESSILFVLCPFCG